MDTPTATTDTISAAIEALSSALAAEITKNMTGTIERLVEARIDGFVNSQDFYYMLEDAAKDKMEEIVQDYIDNLSLSVRID